MISPANTLFIPFLLSTALLKALAETQPPASTSLAASLKYNTVFFVFLYPFSGCAQNACLLSQAM